MAAPTPVPATPIRNSYWVLPGKVLAGEHPSGTNKEATRDRLARLLQAGVECFIDLTESGELKRYDSELPFGIEYLRKPIKDHGIPGQRGHMIEILDCLHDALQSGRCVYVHCRAGIGRTGTVIGCFLVERGHPGEAALDELNRLWQHCERSNSWPSVPETDEQTNYIRRWKARGVFDDLAHLKAPVRGASDLPQPHILRGGGVAGTSAAAVGAGTAGAGAERGSSPWAHLLIDEPSAGATSVGAGRGGDARTPQGSRVADDGSMAGARANAAGGSTARQVSGAGQSAAGSVAQPGGGDTLRQPGGAAARQAGATPHTVSPNTTAAGRGPAASTTGAQSLFADPASVARDAIAAASGAAQPTPVEDGGSPDSAFGGVDDADLLSDPDALAAANHLRMRFLGALVGLAAGDAVAAATQYRRPGTFTPVGDMLGGGPFDLPRGAWSDDTAMALCLADSLLERNGFDARDQVERYRRWQQEGYLSATGQCVGITASSARAITMAQWRRQAFAGSHDPSQLDPEPLSRVAAAVLFFFANASQAIDHATEAARTTCQAPAVLDACRSLARALHAALSGQPKATVLELAAQAAVTNAGASAARVSPAAGAPSASLKVSGRRSGRARTAGGSSAVTDGTANVARRSARSAGESSGPSGSAGATDGFTGTAGGSTDAAGGFSGATSGSTGAGGGFSGGSTGPGSGFSGATSGSAGSTNEPFGAPGARGVDVRIGSSAPGALAAAVAAFGATDNFRDAILYAVNLGGDSDVVAAVCGQLAGAYYGVKAIPTSWYNGLMQKELIINYADRLLARAMLGLSG